MSDITATLPAHLTDRAPTEVKAKNVLGKDDFLKLLMAQLNNQDPLKPMEHQEMAAQLAQFGQLEQLQNIHKGIEGLQGGMGNESKLSALGMIGKQVQATGNEVNVTEGDGAALAFAKKEGVTPVKASIYGGDGKLVREMDLDPRTTDGEVKWDGKDQDGKAVATGKYTFRVQGVNQSGQAQELGTELSGRVIGVEMEGASPVLMVQTASGNSRLELNRVHAVGLAEEPKAAPKTEARGIQNISVPAATEKSDVPVRKIDMSEMEGAEPPEPMEAGVRPLEDHWQGFPAFASFQDLK